MKMPALFTSTSTLPSRSATSSGELESNTIERETKEQLMRIVISDFMSLDGVVQAPGGREEDKDGGFTNGGWSVPYFDVPTMGAAIGEVMQSTEALLFGRRTWQTMAAASDTRQSLDRERPCRRVPPHDRTDGARGWQAPLPR